MDISGFLNQTATFEEHTGEDFYTNSTFNAPVQIRVRKDTKHKLGKKTRHDNYISVTVWMTEQPIKIRDRIDGEDIYAVENIVDFDGTVIGWMAFPRPPIGFAN